MSKISPCLWFDGDAEAAAGFYTSLFADSKVLSVGRYGEGMPLPVGTVMMVELELGGQSFQALNGGPQFKITPSLSFFVQLGDPAEARRLFDALAAGGKVMMPLSAYPWSPCYAWVQDRFGVSWQLIVGAYAAGAPPFVPCLMFSDAQHGRAEEAMRHYTGIFPQSRIERVERYGQSEGPVDTVKHGRFVIAGQEVVAMDSHVIHGFGFNEGVSLSVRCEDQAEVDRLWAALTEGGAAGPCGWLKDRFGVSWQIVPEALVTLLAKGDGAASGRMFAAMMGMQRLEIAELERAYQQA
jgi:predicted 3-demethylubiquinone-9 3-methyltransferase (glyoxalase superfamily)